MSETSFNFTGLLRSLQGGITTVIGILIAILILYALVHWIVTKLADRDEIDEEPARKWTNRCAVVLVAIVLFSFVWHAAIVASVNRMPRADIDKSGVYEQMDSNINKK